MSKVTTWFQANKSTVWSVGGVVLVILIIILGTVIFNNKDGEKASSELQTPTETALESKSAPAMSYIAKAPSVDQPKMSYDAALAAFGDNRIQFDDHCTATPISSTYKQGTKLMIDNRSGIEKVFHINGASYPIKAYDYVVMTLTSPDTVMVNCGDMKNVATVLVQK